MHYSGNPLWRHLITILIAGWFYAHLWHRFGTIAAFNRPIAAAATLPAQHLQAGGIFTDPVQDQLHAQVAPILYSETWGDYWCFFLVWGRQIDPPHYLRSRQLLERLRQGDPAIVTNRYEIAPYLAWVNRVSVLPSLVLLAGLIAGVLAMIRWIKRPVEPAMPMCTIVILACLGGYALFLLETPTTNFDTVKASYILEIFPLLSLLAAGFLATVANRFSRRRSTVGGIGDRGRV